jgi:hypothetical protein
MKQMHLPLIPAEAGIQTESTDTSLSLLGRRFRGDERMGAVGSIAVKLALGAAFRGG